MRDFFGRSTLFCKDGNALWMFDEATGGVLYLDLDANSVSVELDPYHIKQRLQDTIRGIFKDKNFLILVPQKIWIDWIVYDTKQHTVNSVHPVSEEIVISEVIDLRDTIYILPLEVSDPIIQLLPTDNKECLPSYEVRLIEHEITNHGFCFGASIRGDHICYPVYGTQTVCDVSDGSLKKIKTDIPERIASVDHEETYWILPTNGNKIYQVDDSGKVLELVELCEDGNTHDANEFTRIIIRDGIILLFPFYGNYIFFHHEGINGIQRITLNDISYWGLLDETVNCSFWNYVIHGRTMLFPPYRYRLTGLDLDKRRMDTIDLRWKSEYDRKKYSEWAEKTIYDGEKIFHERTESSLYDFMTMLLQGA